MMTPRERMSAAIAFEKPDRIPLFYHPSTAGFHVHGTKLADLFARVPGDNLVTFDPDRKPPENAVSPDGSYHEFRRDEWGTLWEYLIFGIQGHPKEYPLRDWKTATEYRFPPIPDIPAIPPEKRENHLIFEGYASLFERTSALRPFDETIMDFFEEDPDLLRFVDRLVDYYLEWNARWIKAGSDVFSIGDDFGTQNAALFPPALFERIFVPRYRRLIKPIKQAGRKVLFHSCGFIDPILKPLFDLGIDLLWPQLSIYGRREEFLDLCAENRVALLLHPDRQYLIPRGKPAEIRAWVRDMAARYRNGGGIFYVEMENDAPWENVVALLEAIAEYR